MHQLFFPDTRTRATYRKNFFIARLQCRFHRTSQVDTCHGGVQILYSHTIRRVLKDLLSFSAFRNLRYKSNHIQQDFYIVHLFFLTHSILPEITAKMAAQSFALASRVTIQRPSIALPAARRPHARSIVSRPVQSKLSGPKPSSNNNNNRPNIFAVRLPKWDDIQQLPLMPIVS